jgi:hypothetical protein
VVGSESPLLGLSDLDRGAPVVLAGQPGRVVWVTFWTARQTSGPEHLRALQVVWDQLSPFRQFTMVAAAVDAARPEAARAAVAAAGADMPVYLATPKTQQAYGAGKSPLTVLSGANSRVCAVARGTNPATLQRLAQLAHQRLDRLEPPQRGQFALGTQSISFWP